MRISLRLLKFLIWLPTGWIGIPLIVITCGCAGYLGIILGRCWLLLQERKPELYAGKCRRPWAAIAFEALGEHGR